MTDRIEDRIEEAALAVWEGARGVLSIVLLGGWMGVWLLIALIGWIFAYPPVITVSAAIVAITLLAVIVRRASRRRKLVRRAERELLARTMLEGVKVDRDLAAVLAAFDVAYKNVREVLEGDTRIDETLAVQAALDLERVREHLWRITVGKASLIKDVKSLGRSSRVGAVASMIDDARRRLGEHQREAEQIAKDTQRLGQRLSEVSRLAQGAVQAAPKRELEQVLQELDRTAAAYREIEAAEDETARKLRALRALRNASGTS